MRRIVLALAMTIGLAIGTVVPASALDTSVTLNCSDGTSVKLVLDADSLTSLTQSVQAMIDYPAGLSCAIIQNPLGVTFGSMTLAASSPFIVGGGRWQVPCALILGIPNGAVDGGLVARVPGAWYSVRAPAQQTDDLVWVNVAVNAHMKDGTPFGTLNETIPAKQFCGDVQVGESHFNSTPVCFTTPLNVKDPVYVTSQVNHASDGSGQVPFLAAGSPISPNDFLHFAFQDNANPPGQNPSGVPSTDLLNGPPASPEGLPQDNTCTPGVPLLVDTTTGIATFHLGAFDGSKQYGNISVHP